MTQRDPHVGRTLKDQLIRPLPNLPSVSQGDSRTLSCHPLFSKACDITASVVITYVCDIPSDITHSTHFRASGA